MSAQIQEMTFAQAELAKQQEVLQRKSTSVRSSRLSQIRESQNSPMRQGGDSPVLKQELRSFTPTAQMLAESEANLRSGADVMQVAQDLA